METTCFLSAIYTSNNLYLLFPDSFAECSVVEIQSAFSTIPKWSEKWAQCPVDGRPLGWNERGHVLGFLLSLSFVFVCKDTQLVFNCNICVLFNYYFIHFFYQIDKNMGNKLQEFKFQLLLKLQNSLKSLNVF